MSTKMISWVIASMISGLSATAMSSTLEGQDACLEAAEASLAEAVKLASDTYFAAADQCSKIRVIDALNGCVQDAYETYAAAVDQAEAAKKADVSHCL